MTDPTLIERPDGTVPVPYADLELWGNLLGEAEGCIKALSGGLSLNLPNRLRREYLRIARYRGTASVDRSPQGQASFAVLVEDESAVPKADAMKPNNINTPHHTGEPISRKEK